jgi:hypothetical protein
MIADQPWTWRLADLAEFTQAQIDLLAMRGLGPPIWLDGNGIEHWDWFYVPPELERIFRKSEELCPMGLGDGPESPAIRVC